MERITEQKEAEEMFLRELESHIEMVKEGFSKLPKPLLNDHIIEDAAMSCVEDFLYSNLLLNYKDNLIDEDNRLIFNITKIDAENIEKEFEILFKKCDKKCDKKHGLCNSIEEVIDYNTYCMFKERLNKISEHGYTLLIGMEKFMNLPACQDRINEFGKEAKTLGREPDVIHVELPEEGIYGIEVKYEDDDEE